MTTQEKVAAAVGVSWENFKARHPNQAEAIERLGDPVELICDQLAEDQAYQDQVALFDTETSITTIVNNIAPFIMTAIGMIAAL